MDQNSLINYSQHPSFGVAPNFSEAICSSLTIKFNDAAIVISVIILGLINVMVIAGNILVIVSVFVTTKLRTVTNFFIVSLAVADLLVGIAVLPYSLTLEILDFWIFGSTWCQAWLAVDVWMCTASILNLCAISVDRYLAVTRPVRYRSIMTSKRAKLMIAAVWVLSFIICFPPLVGWNNDDDSVPIQGKNNNIMVELLLSTQHPNLLNNEQSEHTTIYFDGNMTTSSTGKSERTYTSMLIQHAGQTRIDNQNANSSSSRGDARCGYTAKCALVNEKGYVIYSAVGSFYIPMLLMILFYWRIYLVASRTSRALKRGYKTTKSSKSGDGAQEERLTLRIHRGYGIEENTLITEHFNDTTTTLSVASTSPKIRTGILKQTINETEITEQSSTSKSKDTRKGKRPMPITLYRSSRLTANLTANNNQQNGGNRRMSPSSQSTLSLPSSTSPCSSREGSARSAKLAMTRFSKRTSKYQAKRFHAETKAAKTVGIIVGGFILCWLPFFTAYLTRAFCEDSSCIPDLLFRIFTWLGYCNSMINPCIYGLFSKDFRRAFKNILCRCKFREETVSSLIRQIHMPTFFEDAPEDMTKTESQED